MTLNERLQIYFESLREDEIVEIYNQYAQECNYDEVYYMTEFDDVLGNTCPTDIANMIYHGDFDPYNTFFWFDGCGNLGSSDYPSEDDNSPVYVQDIIDYIEENRCAFGDDGILEIINEYEETEE